MTTLSSVHYGYLDIQVRNQSLKKFSVLLKIPQEGKLWLNEIILMYLAHAEQIVYWINASEKDSVKWK